MLKETKKFYNSTKFSFNQTSEKNIDLEWPLAWTKIFYKIYSRFPRIKLKYSTKNKKVCLEKLLNERDSDRDFSIQCPLSYLDISNILYYSAGIRSSSKRDIENARRRYPSAGARYPIEIYLIANNIELIDRGLYHYCIIDNTLEVLLKQDLRKDMKILTNSEMGEKSSALIIMTSVLSRSESKYRNNAYRFSLIESGHIAQNISLIAQKYNLKCCAMGGFDNDKISKLIDLTDDEPPLYIIAVGK